MKTPTKLSEKHELVPLHEKLTSEEKEKLLRSIISGRIIAVTTAHGYIERVKGKAFVVCDINVQMKK